MSLPSVALATYEGLRAEVLHGQARPQGLAAVVYHGMLRGLAVILTGAAAPSSPAPPPRAPAADGVHIDRELLRLIANMMLQSQSQVTHVY
ncbi:MAG: elements of external origin [Gammaproteobacteria bacterium]|jgi:hypothetical protein|nr:elements of external origin [Gammaproteobacteria bacterium]